MRVAPSAILDRVRAVSAGEVSRDAAKARRRFWFWAHAVVVVVAAVLRFTHLGFAPSTPWARPDEEIFAAVAAGLFADSNPHVGHTGWPELFFWAHHAVQRVLLAYWTWAEGAEPHLGCVFVLEPWRLILPARAMSAAFGVVTVPLVAWLAYLAAPRESLREERQLVALVAGLFYAVNVLAMRDAHFAVSDTALVAFFTAMLVAVARGMALGRKRDFLAAGVALGLAISTKWTGLSFGMMPFFALIVRLRRHGITLLPGGRNVAARGNLWAIALGVIGLVGAFVLTSPSVLDEPRQYWDGLFSHAMRYDPNNYQAFSFRAHTHATPGFVQHGTISYPFAFGWPLTVVSVAAALWALVRGVKTQDPMRFLLGLFVFFFWGAVVGRTTMNFARYSLPVHPVFAVLAALALLDVAKSARLYALRELLAKTVVTRVATVPPFAGLSADAAGGAVVVLGATLLLAAEPTWRSIDYVRILGLTDTRELARSWMIEHAPDVATETLGGYGRLYAIEHRLDARCTELVPASFRAEEPILDYRVDQSAHTTSARTSWRDTAGAALYPVLFRGSPPRLRSPWVVVSRAFLPCGQETVRYDGQDPDPACYVERAHFGPGDVACGAQYDEQDHFYAPLWGYAGLENLGPSVSIYENVCMARATGESGAASDARVPARAGAQ